ncbi:sugar nucleotide-binding protein [Clostridium sp. CS001]|uniref:SDR family oxidoreductase n=1 Tax=Clostridium sp. CS001 TaxID=2880648 RepID=UPI001CF50351|nr:sugar nucleotide-binding protein [Clostridium sp. CS001]MCB2289721.1 sugar nucleotide-binding protein [Clostridium sp. CS001]
MFKIRKTILITGANGFFASRFIDSYKSKYNIISFGHNDLDITNENKTIEIVEKYNPDYLIHAAAISDTGICETNPYLSFDVNVRGSINIAKACSISNSKLIYLSSDQVYNGNTEIGPYNENCIATSNTVYSNHKLEAENKITEILNNACILRLTWLFTLPEKSKKTNANIICNVLSAALKNEILKLPSHEYRGITYVYDLIDNFDKILNLPSGIYNTGSENDLSTYDIGTIVLNKMGLSHRINEVLLEDTERYNLKSRDLRICNDKLKQHGIFFSKTEEAIARCIKDFLFIS